VTIAFAEFDAHAPIPDETISAFEAAAPEGAAEMWRTWGAGALS